MGKFDFSDMRSCVYNVVELSYECQIVNDVMCKFLFYWH